MQKIPFDMKYRPQIESGQYKVETNAGLPVRIICWDAKNEEPTVRQPIVGLVDHGKYEVVMSWDANGLIYNSKSDLVIVTDWKGMDEVKKHLSDTLNSMNGEYYEQEEIEETVQEEADALLEIFREIFAPVIAEAGTAAVDQVCQNIHARLSLDGNAWCVLLGENLQVGTCGFGDTPAEALASFIKQLLIPIE